MGKIFEVQPVKLFAGLIAQNEASLNLAKNALVERYGPIDSQSVVIDFYFTDYYEAEMGRNLLRQWVSFEKTINPSLLAEIKIITNNIEENISQSGKRSVNIDPGYIALSKVVLASTKDFSHRIYLRDGIYAEITLLYRNKKFVALEWSYADYQSKPAAEFLTRAREIYHSQL